MGKTAETSRGDIYTKITERIVAELEKGVKPWVQPWRAGNAAGRITRPLRHNGEGYSGLNVLLLWAETTARGFVSPYWMTYRQSTQLGGQVRKGESGATVIYASRFTKEETGRGGETTERSIPFLKAYTVFAADQIEGLPEHYYRQPEAASGPALRIERAEEFFANTGADIRYGGDSAYYSPRGDFIQMPPREFFRDAAAHAATLCHELVHASAPHIGRDLSRYHKDQTEQIMEELCALS